MNLPQLPEDKANHYVYGSLIDVGLFFVIFSLTKNLQLANHLAFALTALIACLKEGLDAWENRRATGDYFYGPRGVEFNDALATAMGAVPRWATLTYTTAIS
jgi:hypothetical protein